LAKPRESSAFPFLTDLRQRRLTPEIMDQPGLDEREHMLALRGLARINAWSGSAGILWPALRDLAQAAGSGGIRVLDIASGAGDVPIRLWKRAQRAGLKLQISGCDRSPAAVRAATERASLAGATVHFFTLDAHSEPLPNDFDAITCSLFLHHLETGEALDFLKRSAAAARKLVLVNDLARGQLGYALAWFGTRVLSRSRVVHVDGPLSVRAAFTLTEARSLANEAGLDGARVGWRWPFRFLLRWQRVG
jgi:2-polyprenyl-3-methyl-5-hydroxy-6-metoxy-1,4-benzoquinol methylase